MDNLAFLITLTLAQQAVIELAIWAGADLIAQKEYPKETEAIARAKSLLNWPTQPTIKPLRVIFDYVSLENDINAGENYWPIKIIENKTPKIAYPQAQSPSCEDLTAYKTDLQAALNNIQDWDNLSLLSLVLEKFGSYVSFRDDDVALIDLFSSTAAVAAALAEDPEASELSLISGNLSGIQKFIYTISSDGALKSLRARSFYLELVTEEVVQQILITLQLPRSNIIYAGGGNFYILAPAKDHREINQTLCNKLNGWLLDKFKGKISLAINSETFEINGLNNEGFSDAWTRVTTSLSIQKAQKFKRQIKDLLKIKVSYEPCKVCHRDDTQNLKPLNPQEINSVLACGTCRQMYSLGGQLFNLEAIVRSPNQKRSDALGEVEINGIYYYLYGRYEQVKNLEETEVLYLINNWEISNYTNKNTVLLLLGNYGQKTPVKNENSFIRANEMAARAVGIKRVGYLRMDVDKLGQIFAKGLGDKRTLPRLAGLSRKMSYYFKVYLNSLAECREKNWPDKVKKLSDSDRPNLLFIYAGGDDLFVSGAWNETVEFAFDIYQSFRGYTGNNPEITISAGVSLATNKYPLYQAADESEKAEKKAKSNGRDSLGLFGQVFKWEEWLGDPKLATETEAYLQSHTRPECLGVLPFVKKLNKIDVNYSRGFIRDLLAIAELQEKLLKNIQEKNEKEDVRYFLHLPKIAYTLSRLPEQVAENEEFKPVKAGLKSPYNAPYFRAIATWVELLNRSE